MDLLFGAGLLIAAVLALRLSMPRDGQVRGFLRNDEVQAYYVVALLGAMAVGVIYFVIGLRGMLD